MKRVEFITRSLPLLVLVVYLYGVLEEAFLTDYFVSIGLLFLGFFVAGWHLSSLLSNRIDDAGINWYHLLWLIPIVFVTEVYLPYFGLHIFAILYFSLWIVPTSKKKEITDDDSKRHN